MADLTLSFTLQDGKIDEYVAHYVYIHKNTENNPDGSPKYTDKQWVREHIMRNIRQQVLRGRNAKYQADITAYNANGIT